MASVLAAKDSSLPLAAAALARIADDGGRAPFSDLAVAYREDFLKLRAHAKGELQDTGSLSVDDARSYLATSVLPRLAMLKVIVLPMGALWGDVPIAFAPDLWTDMSSDRATAARHFYSLAEETVARSESVSGDHPLFTGGSRLDAQHLVKAYKGRRVVNNVSLELAQGEIVGLLGPNGAGKTTCFYMITGLIRPDEGRILLDSRDITSLPMYRRAHAGIGYLAQEPSIFRKLTVEENVLAILETLKLDAAEQERRLELLLDELGIKALRREKAYQLSGGERRRLEITRALVTEPKFLLLDEPFAGVDPIAVNDIQTIVAGLRHRGIGVLITDHNVEQTLDIVDRAYIMFEGKVQVAGTVRELVFDDRVASLYLGPTLTTRLRTRLAPVTA
ncbi:MAG TPA: LPS export ABC transporter ATP-binding protein [Gemmatimonadales bacterium]